MSVQYTLIRSSRRTLALEITRDLQVIVRAPHRVPKQEIDRAVGERADWIATHLERQRLRAQTFPEPNEQERQALIARAKAIIPERVAHFGAQMGLVPAGIRITGAVTRFGSCSTQNRLCFSWRLMRYPQQAIDYVVVHELAHIVHKNHGKDFYKLIASILPDYKERQKLLKNP